MPQYVTTVKIRGFCLGDKDEAKRSLIQRLIKVARFDEKDIDIVSIEEEGKTPRIVRIVIKEDGDLFRISFMGFEGGQEVEEATFLSTYNPVVQV